ncbi:MAG: caspase family protein [Bacteroidales bacterium]
MRYCKKCILLVILATLFFSAKSQVWNLVMSKGTGYTDQLWRTRSNFPQDEIKTEWDKGYYITDLTFHENLWALVMSRGTKFSEQMWRTRTYFPEKEIDEFWEKKYHITHLTYGNGVWGLVMSKMSIGDPVQLWRTREYFPENEIKENWDKGYYITSLVYGEGKWALVMTKNLGYTEQVWRTRNYYPEQEIKEFWDKGYYITNLTYGNGVWALVMSKGSGFNQQWWRTRTTFPEKEIKELWDQGGYITGLSQGIYIKNTDQPVVENTPPEITITEPIIERGFKIVTLPSVKVAGTATDADGIASVYVNGINAALDNSGFFYTNIPLIEGENIIRIVATDTKGAVGEKSFTIQNSKQHVTDNPVDVSQKRLALVMGNSSYLYGGTLKNPVNDANAMKLTLESLGFKVLKCENCSQNDMKRMIDDFGAQLENYDVGLFFYAGHGIQYKGINYLIPVDSKLDYERDIEYNCVEADRVLAKMEGAKSKINLIILDACRDNPFERSWNRGVNSGGLAFMDAPSGSLIAYSTSPGKTASDGNGSNGLYTTALLEYIQQSGMQIEDMFKKVRQKVIQDSDGKQTPWESTSLTKDFYFKF